MARDQPLLAVLIDADNIPAKHATAILEEITRYGEPSLRRVYGDWNSERLGKWLKQVQELGLVARQETANTTGKNASDIGLVIDAMDILHSKRFDGFVIVSSDSDFTALANRLREDGVDVIGIGEKKTPKSFQKVCNRFVVIDNILDTADSAIVEPVADSAAKVSTAAKPVKKRAVAQSADKPAVEPSAPEAAADTPEDKKKDPPSKAVPLVIKAMKDIDIEGEWYGLGSIGSQVNRANPDFDPRTYGSPKLSDLLTKTGHFELRKTDGQWEVRRKPTRKS